MHLLLCYYHENFNLDQKTLTYTKECHDRATKSVKLYIRFREAVRDKTSNACHNVLKLSDRLNVNAAMKGHKPTQVLHKNE